MPGAPTKTRRSFGGHLVTLQQRIAYPCRSDINSDQAGEPTDQMVRQGQGDNLIA